MNLYKAAMKVCQPWLSYQLLQPHRLNIDLVFLTLLRAQESLTMEARAKSIPIPKAKSAPTAKAKAKVKAKAKPDPKPAAVPKRAARSS